LAAALSIATLFATASLLIALLCGRFGLLFGIVWFLHDAFLLLN